MTSAVLGPRVHIVEVSTEGFVLADGNLRWLKPWTTVIGISAARVPYSTSGKRDMLVLAFGLDGGRVVMVARSSQSGPKLSRR